MEISKTNVLIESHLQNTKLLTGGRVNFLLPQLEMEGCEPILQ